MSFLLHKESKRLTRLLAAVGLFLGMSSLVLLQVSFVMIGVVALFISTFVGIKVGFGMFSQVPDVGVVFTTPWVDAYILRVATMRQLVCFQL